MMIASAVFSPGHAGKRDRRPSGLASRAPDPASTQHISTGGCPVSSRQAVTTEPVSIRTADGDCRAWLFTPEGAGPRPAVIFYMDGMAIRPALLDMAARLASGGYV